GDVDIALLDLEKSRRRWRVASASRRDLGQLDRHRGAMPDADMSYLHQAYQQALNDPWGGLQP
ncbi:lipopolysaccharide kinase InaA family protein, partial [Ectopseudomonas oleovorans]